LITKQEILDCVKKLAKQIHLKYSGQRPIFVCVLKGANNFYQNLLEELQELGQGYTTEFLRASSYEGTSTTGSVKIGSGFSFDALRDRHVVLVEDIVDTGTTLSKVIPEIHSRVPVKSVEVCSLLLKRLDQPPKVTAKFVGFSVPNHFIIGYGLDYNELYRDLRDIWVISQAGVEFDGSSWHR
jgi:hypoxanthine phosphoribosyltransferase